MFETLKAGREAYFRSGKVGRLYQQFGIFQTGVDQVLIGRIRGEGLKNPAEMKGAHETIVCNINKGYIILKVLVDKMLSFFQRWEMISFQSFWNHRRFLDIKEYIER